mgnify:CR=1 FL=1
MFSKANKFIFLVIIVALVGTTISACSTSSSSEVHLAMSPLDQMPMDVQSAPVAVQEAYQFNVANPDIMQDIPCYCGCGDIGHTSNYDCYVSDVDITQDVMRMLNDGKSPQDARAYVDATYSKYGPSNIP